MELGLTGRTALVTGASMGLGYAVARELYFEGADVVLASRSRDHLKQAVAELEPLRPGGSVRAVEVDLNDPTRIAKEVGKLVADTRIDILVNNVGGPAAGSPLDIPLEKWDEGYQKLLRSVIQLCQLLVPPMEQRGWGRVLTITSSSAREIIPKLPVSSTFRAGLTGWTKELAKAVGRSGVLVNNLLPGPVRTGRLEELKVKSPEFYATMETKSALGRVGEPEEIGRIAAFLCSQANGFITGTDVLADGGFTSAL